MDADREKIETLKNVTTGDADLVNCCDYLLGNPTFVGMTRSYADARVAKALAEVAAPAPIEEPT